MKKISDATGSFFAALTVPLLRFPKTLVLLMRLACGECELHLRNLGMDTDTTKYCPGLPFLQDCRASARTPNITGDKLGFATVGRLHKAFHYPSRGCVDFGHVQKWLEEERYAA
jgi:hypothetical protein